MPTMTSQKTNLAAGVTKGLFAGAVHEYITRPSVVTMLITSSEISYFVTLSNGRDILIADQEITSIKANTPIRPDDVMHQSIFYPGDRVIVDLRNGSAGVTGDITVCISIDPIA